MEVHLRLRQQQQQGSPHTQRHRRSQKEPRKGAALYICYCDRFPRFLCPWDARSVIIAPPTFFRTGQAHWIQVQRLYWSQSEGSGGLRGPPLCKKGSVAVLASEDTGVMPLEDSFKTQLAWGAINQHMLSLIWSDLGELYIEKAEKRTQRFILW